MFDSIPRILIAAPASGHGKTTVATGLMAALCRRGTTVAPFKVGPDYIDPGYHRLATGRLGRNLDPHLCSTDLIVPLLKHGMITPDSADLAVIEGVMGLFDGKLGSRGFGSSAHVAVLTQTPVVLCVDVSHTSRTIGAWVHGLATYDPGIRIAGVVVNKVGSPRHLAEVRAGIEPTGIPVLGALPRDAGISAPERHLGLVPVAERDDAAHTLDRLADQVAAHIDLDAVLALAGEAPKLPGPVWDPAAQVHPPPGSQRPVVAVAGGRAFTFNYAETTELLAAGGCRIETVDPLNDVALPPGTCGLYLGGGFPEMHAADLSSNADLRREVAYAARRGLPIVAECAGLLYLAASVDETPMTGVVRIDAVMSPRLTMGYRSVTAPAHTLLARRGERITGHEFHRTRLASDPDPGTPPAWRIDDRDEGVSLDPAGRGVPTVHASYLHTHWAGHPGLAQRFIEAVHAFSKEVPYES